MRVRRWALWTAPSRWRWSLTRFGYYDAGATFRRNGNWQLVIGPLCITRVQGE